MKGNWFGDKYSEVDEEWKERFQIGISRDLRLSRGPLFEWIVAGEVDRQRKRFRLGIFLIIL